MLDLAVVGGGAAGISAAVYAERRALKVALFEPGQLGGTINEAPRVENYLGYPTITGPELAARFAEHLRAHQEISLVTDKVSSISREGGAFSLKTEGGETHEARAIILATGAAPRRLGAPGEAQFAGKGVSYCATCDGPLFKGKRVAVAGGGDAAVVSALYLAEIAKEVHLVHRREELRAEETLVVQARQVKNISFHLGRTIAEVKGGKFLESIIIQGEGGAREELQVEGLFVYIGHDPANSLAKSLGCELDGKGLVKVGPGMDSTVPGVYAAGDVRSGSSAQLIAAAGDGCVAALSAAAYVKLKR